VFRRAMILCAAIAGFACGAPVPPPIAAPKERPAIPVRTAPVTRADLSSTITATGDIRALSSVMVLPRGSGRIERVARDVGTEVRVGDALAEIDRESAALALRQAEAGAGAARARLQSIESGARPEQVAIAASGARAARVRFESLRAGGRTEAVAQAEAAAKSARDRLAALRDPRPEGIAQADANVAAAQARLDAVLKGPTPEQIRAAEVSIESARNVLYVLQTTRDAACRTTGFACDGAQGQVMAAEAGVRVARQNLALLTAPPTAEVRAQLQAGLDAARQQAAIARRPASAQDLAAAEAAVRQAEAVAEIARKPSTELELDAARAQADAADAAERIARQPFTEFDRAIAAAALAQAEAQVSLAREQLDEATIRAPIDGVIAERFATVGATANPQAPLFVIITRGVEARVALDETQIGRIRSDQMATIEGLGLGAAGIPARVIGIAPVVDARSRTVAVRLVPAIPIDPRLRPGMIAQVAIEAARIANALVIPRAALVSTEAPAVLIVDGGVVKRVPVRLGVQEGDRLQVVDGLRDGDQVIVDVGSVREGDRVVVSAAG